VREDAWQIPVAESLMRTLDAAPHRQDPPSPRRCAALAPTVGAHLRVTSAGALALVGPHLCRCGAAPRPAPTPVCRRVRRDMERLPGIRGRR
jgi:hypothetical protein